jgi:hypothetical protein
MSLKKSLPHMTKWSTDSPGRNLLMACKSGEVVHCMRPLEVETTWVHGSVTDRDRVGGWPS